MPSSTPSGTLYIVATPIGNLEDITFRAVRILQEVDVIAAEDTRHTRKLLNHYAIHTPLISYYREKEASRADELLEKLQSGLNIAVVSDAGTPGISDPGALIVQQAHDAGIRVCPIPGASALTAALSVAGLDQLSVMFCGFAPAKPQQRRKFCTRFASYDTALVFYESPRRIRSFLQDALAVFGNRQALISRELTKTFEEIRRMTLAEAVESIDQTEERGEYVLIIWPDQQESAQTENIDELILWYQKHSGLSLKDASRKIAQDLNLSRTEVYQKALFLWKNSL